MIWIKVKKKPVEVEAFQLTQDLIINNDNCIEICEINGRRIDFFQDQDAHVKYWRKFCVETLEGDMYCNIGDYIIKGVKGEIYPCRKDIFEETYEVIEK